MKARLTKAQVQMLLDGKDLTYGRCKIGIPREGKIPDELRKWIGNETYWSRYDVLVDTAEGLVYFEKKGGVRDGQTD